MVCECYKLTLSSIKTGSRTGSGFLDTADLTAKLCSKATQHSQSKIGSLELGAHPTRISWLRGIKEREIRFSKLDMKYIGTQFESYVLASNLITMN